MVPFGTMLKVGADRNISLFVFVFVLKIDIFRRTVTHVGLM